MSRVRSRSVILALMALLLADCSSKPNHTAEPNNAAALATGTMAARDRGPLTNSSAQPHAIPAALVGKWGLKPADCDYPVDDDKGVLIVRADGLDIYDTHAQLAAVVSGGDDRVLAAFSFAGGGRNWTREEELRLQSDGKSLIRREVEGDPPAMITYVRCPR